MWSARFSIVQQNMARGPHINALQLTVLIYFDPRYHLFMFIYWATRNISSGRLDAVAHGPIYTCKAHERPESNRPNSFNGFESESSPSPL